MSSYKSFIEENLNQLDKKLPKNIKNIDLYSSLQESKVLDEAFYTVKILELNSRLNQSLKMKLALKESKKINNVSLIKVQILETKSLMTNVESYMFLNNTTKVEVGSQYRFQGLLMLIDNSIPLLGYGNRGSYIPPRFMGGTNINWEDSDCIIPPYKIFQVPKARKESYYTETYNVHFKKKNHLKRIDLDTMCKELNMDYENYFKDVVDSRVYPFVQILCESDLILKSVKPVLDYVYGSWGTFKYPLEVTLKGNTLKNQSKMWVHFVKDKKDLYLDLPTIDIYS